MIFDVIFQENSKVVECRSINFLRHAGFNRSLGMWSAMPCSRNVEIFSVPRDFIYNYNHTPISSVFQILCQYPYAVISVEKSIDWTFDKKKASGKNFKDDYIEVSRTSFHFSSGRTFWECRDWIRSILSPKKRRILNMLKKS